MLNLVVRVLLILKERRELVGLIVFLKNGHVVLKTSQDVGKETGSLSPALLNMCCTKANQSKAPNERLTYPLNAVLVCFVRDHKNEEKKR